GVNAVSQWVTIRYDGANWNVTGSSTPSTLCSIPVSNNADCGSPVQFHLAIGGAAAVAGDKADFALIAASSDTNVQKQLQFGKSGLTGSRSKLEIDNTGGFH